MGCGVEFGLDFVCRGIGVGVGKDLGRNRHGQTSHSAEEIVCIVTCRGRSSTPPGGLV